LDSTVGLVAVSGALNNRGRKGLSATCQRRPERREEGKSVGCRLEVLTLEKQAEAGGMMDQGQEGQRKGRIAWDWN